MKQKTVPLDEALVARLRSLSGEALQIQAKVGDAYAARGRVKPMVGNRETLRQDLFSKNSRIQELQNTAGKRETAERQKLSESVLRIEGRIAECNDDIEKLYQPFVQLGGSVHDFVHRLKSALTRLPPDKAQRREQINQLPLLTRGLGTHPTEVIDDLSTIHQAIEAILTEAALPAHGASTEQDIGGQLQEKRKERSHTQEQVAEALQCATSTISRIERGNQSPGRELKQRIEKYIATPS